jgi:lysophospholipase L1-like esterase
MLATLTAIIAVNVDRTHRAAAILVTLIAVVLPGCGGGSEEPPREPPEPKPQPGNRVIASLGDSITAGTPHWDPDPARREAIGSQLDRQSQYGYWAEREQPGSDFRNCGVPGERTDEIALRFEDCVRAADGLVVQGGVNDISQGIPPAEIAPNLRDIVRRGKRAGLDVAIVELLPWNGGYPNADAPIRDLNRRIARLAEDEGVRLIRWYGILENPARPGRMRPRWTVDGAHPSVAGYRRLGEAVELP